jgi:hypothetical protein
MKQGKELKSIDDMKSIKGSFAMSGKMLGINCISTNNLSNPLCAKFKDIEGSVCQKCFADKTAKTYGTLRDNLEANSKLLASNLPTDDELPVLVDDIFRIESFGDLQNVVQARNYLRIIKANPSTMFAWWTKHPSLVLQAIELEGKPANVNLILSSLMINHQASMPAMFDKVFTVYDDETIANKSIDVNCGARSCRGCMACYTKNDVKIVNERLK